MNKEQWQSRAFVYNEASDALNLLSEEYQINTEEERKQMKIVAKKLYAEAIKCDKLASNKRK